MQLKVFVHLKNKLKNMSSTNNSHIKKIFSSKSKTYGSWFELSHGTRHISNREKLALQQLISNHAHKSITELGCGNGRIATYLNTTLSFSTYNAVDISPKMISEIKHKKIKGLKTIVSDANTYKISPKADVTISIRQIKYNQQFEKQIHQMAENTKRGGIILLDIPGGVSVSALRNHFLVNNERIVSKRELEKVIYDAGFEDITYHPQQYLPDWVYMKVNSDTTLQICIKIETLLKKLFPPDMAKSIFMVARRN